MPRAGTFRLLSRAKRDREFHRSLRIGGSARPRCHAAALCANPAGGSRSLNPFVLRFDLVTRATTSLPCPLRARSVPYCRVSRLAWPASRQQVQSPPPQSTNRPDRKRQGGNRIVQGCPAIGPRFGTLRMTPTPRFAGKPQWNRELFQDLGRPMLRRQRIAGIRFSPSPYRSATGNAPSRAPRITLIA